jgi:hypothetical protein
VALLFALGSLCFVLGSVPLYYDHVDANVVGVTFFVGSVLFTSAATLQVRASRTSAALFARDPARVNWWSAAVQWVGTLEFNLSTFAALVTGLSASQEKRLVWSPDFYGSALFLASSVLALVAVGMVVATRRDRGIAWLNMIGSIMFGVAAVAAYVLPTTGEPINIRWVNAGTALGGVCFFAASVWMGRPVTRSPADAASAG